jgi:hypothetical protein
MEVLEVALRRNRVSMNSRFVEEVFRSSPRFAMVRERNAALANRDRKALMQFHDLPLTQLCNYWDSAGVREKQNLRAEAATASPTSEPVPTKVRKDRGTRDAKDRLCRDLQAATEAQTAKRARRASSP